MEIEGGGGGETLLRPRQKARVLPFVSRKCAGFRFARGGGDKPGGRGRAGRATRSTWLYMVEVVEE